MSYIGFARRPFKNILYEHRASFLKPSKKKPTNCTQLANHIWKLYNKGEKYTVEWKILRQTNSRFKPNFLCQLCNLERLYIANANQRKILNKRNELVTQCPHYPREYFQFQFTYFVYLFFRYIYFFDFLIKFQSKVLDELNRS